MVLVAFLCLLQLGAKASNFDTLQKRTLTVPAQCCTDGGRSCVSMSVACMGNAGAMSKPTCTKGSAPTCPSGSQVTVSCGGTLKCT